eukprot:CAMPEP_0113876262 /NCGR_PEP_ID=MMETSP0780_2-20120614/5392_1 /TAXON_ID=652834 /ORGANISM="Palpitomonas bilix" /LENGTH=561 /DNA_ID=CAMNT_0000862327 /DNA_START=159 /DNA_END=1844 /DNA_ORIENTATION=+ /assembly_acc=CAM_ASM_000599
MEEEYGDMQERYKMLEGERKSAYETSQFTIKQNRDTVATVKKENKDLRQALAQLQKEQAFKGAGDASAELDRLNGTVSELRKRYDDLRHTVYLKSKELEGLQDKLRDLERESIKPNMEDNPLTRQIRTLENRLDKAMIKYNEAQSIRKTYEQIVKRLKEERIGFDNQLAALERQLRQKDKDLEELVLMSHEAQHSKDVAKGELVTLEKQLDEDRARRERELNDRRQLVQQKLDMSQKMEKREKMRKELQLEAAGDLSAEGEDNLKKSLYTSAFHHAVNESKLEEEQEKITTYEDAFRKIKDATGVSDVNEVIQKFLTQDTTRGNLRNMTKEAQSKIDQLNDERTQLKAKVEEIKYSGTGSLGSRRIVDEFETQLSDANAKLERNRQKYERIARILIDVKAGIEHLSDKLESVKIDAAPIPLTDETLVEVLLQAEQKLIKLVEAVNVEEEGAGDVEGDSIKATAALAEKSYTSTAHEVNLPEFNVRIPLSQATEVGEDASDSDGDDEGDEVPDRSEVKQYSAMLLEKANKKPKKGKKKKSNAPAGMGSRSVSRGKKGGQDFD